MELNTVIATLRDDRPSFEWDDAWDKLKAINPSLRSELPLLRDALSDPSPSVRIFALKAIARIGGDLDGVMPEVIPLLKDSEQYVRAEATKVLKRFGQHCASTAVPALRQLANDGDAYLTVRLRALVALLKLKRYAHS
jgi:HEAT repeat protein